MLKLFRQCSVFTSRVSSVRVGFCSNSEESELVEYMNSLNNYEKSGVPVGAGTDSDHGFDLGRMQTLMELLGSPHYNFKVHESVISYSSTSTWRRYKRVKLHSPSGTWHHGNAASEDKEEEHSEQPKVAHFLQAAWGRHKREKQLQKSRQLWDNEGSPSSPDHAV